MVYIIVTSTDFRFPSQVAFIKRKEQNQKKKKKSRSHLEFRLIDVPFSSTTRSSTNYSQDAIITAYFSDAKELEAGESKDYLSMSSSQVSYPTAFKFLALASAERSDDPVRKIALIPASTTAWYNLRVASSTGTSAVRTNS